MGKKSRPSLIKALLFLKQYVETLLKSEKTVLEGSMYLAELACVGRSTMVQGLGLLVQQGALKVEPGVRHSVNCQNFDLLCDSLIQEIGKPPHQAWVRLADKIERHIVDNVIGCNNQLPMLKQMQHSYGVSYKTIRKSIDLLRTRGVICSEGRVIRVATQKRRVVRNKVVLIARGLTRNNEPMLLSENTERMLRAVEQQCLSRDVELIVHSIYYEGTEMRWSPKLTHLLTSNGETDTVLGFMFWTQAITGSVVRQLISKYLAVQPLPVSVYDAEERVSRIMAASSNPKVCYFRSSSNSDGGESVARFIYHKGHKKIAFIGLGQQENWATNRLDGIKKVYNNDILTCNEYNTGSISSTVTQFFDDIEPELVRKLHGEGSSLDDIRKLRAVMAPHFRCSSYIRRCKRSDLLQPVLKSALENRKCTAWVCCNDETALIALDFLDNNGVRVPEDISVIGFDDSVEASMWRLTSYGFNEEALVAVMIEHAFGSQWQKRHKNDSGTIVVQGNVIERGTTL